MNYSKLFLFLLIAMATLVGSCKEDEATSPTSSYYMTATISGSSNIAFSSNIATYTKQNAGTVSQTVLSAPQVVGNVTYLIALQKINYDGALGEINPSQCALSVNDNTGNVVLYNDYSGKLNITKNDNSTIEGTFSFKATSMTDASKNITVTNGKFVIKK